MRIKQLIFVLCVIVVTLSCFFMMSSKYDTLSRYSYDDPEARALIKEHLNPEEIDYIILWSISPSSFIDYIQAEQFNIYRSEIYHQVQGLSFNLTAEDVVSLTENALLKHDETKLYKYLSVYYAHILVEWYKSFDPYVEDAVLIENPGDLLAYVDDQQTVFKQSATNTYVVDNTITKDGAMIYLAYETQEGLNNMCAAISADLMIDRCGGLRIDSGLRNYEQEINIYEEQIANGVTINDLDYPGHSEHQLGLAIDFSVLNVQEDKFEQTKQYKWLKENAHQYGFVQTYTESSAIYTNKLPRSEHFRFVGNIYAAKMFDNNLSLKEVINE